MDCMEIALVLSTAFVLDLILGDPSWFPHPVRGVGHLLSFFEGFFRKRINNERNAGIATAFASIFTGVGLALVLLFLSHLAGRICHMICSVIIVYFSIAAKDLSDHAMRVKKALDSGGIELARKRVSFMVGRDTDLMSESDIIRATVESVAENTVDGVLSPLFWAFILGPAGAFGYRIINTLDSMFGHKNEKYLKFGWFSARLDDAANFLPARLGLFCFAISAKICGLNWKNVLSIGLRDGQKHPSPNSGISEAAMAGALGIQLGGRVFRKGVACDNPLIGKPNVILDKNHVSLACRTMFWSAGVFLLLGSAFSVFVSFWKF